MTTRRNFLIGASQVGALAVMSPKLVFATPLKQKPVRILSTGLVGEQEFHSMLRARLTHAGQVDIASVPLDAAIWSSPTRLAQAMGELSGTRLIAFVEPRNELILMQFLMDRGAAVLVQGEHAVDSKGVSRHDFLSTPSSAGIGRALADSLAKGGSPFSVSVRALGSVTAQPRTNQSEVATHWTTALGTYYADIAVGRWEPQAEVASYGSGLIMAERLDRVASTFIADL